MPWESRRKGLPLNRLWAHAALTVSALLHTRAWSQTPPEQSDEAVRKLQELTLDVMIRQGGPILWVIIALGFVTLVMCVYYFLTITTSREAPNKLITRAADQIRSGDIRGAYQMVQGRDEFIARVLNAEAGGHEECQVAQEHRASLHCQHLVDGQIDADQPKQYIGFTGFGEPGQQQ